MNNNSMIVEFTEEMSTGFINWKGLESWIVETIHNEGYDLGTISFVFMSDERLLEYNRKYLNHDYYTDIITFDDVDFKQVNGDILISVDRVKNNANYLKTSYLDEFCRVVIHGILHLCGFKDKYESESRMMRQKEDFYLDRRSFT